MFKSPIKAVLFDIDGTLVDSLDMLIPGLGDTYEKFADRRPSEEELRAIVGMPLREQMKLFSTQIPTEEKIAQMSAHTLERFNAYTHLERNFDPAVEALERCWRGGLKTALVTSKSDIELSQFLTRFSGAAFCTTTVCASDVTQPKPAPESAILACSKLGATPEEAVFIGDSVFDIRCGSDAGTATVAVLYGAGETSKLRESGPDHIIESPAELLTWVQNELLPTPCLERN